MLKKILKDYWPFLVILLIIFLFFIRLFFPPSLFTTPDFGRSDLTHFNIPMRYTMAQSIKHGHLSLWEPKIGQGFPPIDEGQIGFFYPPNLILFGLLPFWLAFNLGYVVTFLIAALGTYFFARSLKISKEGSTLAAITFAFCPMMVLHIHHYNLIQSLSIFPWILYLNNEFFNTKKYKYMLFSTAVIALQILTGFQQITTYSVAGAILFFIYKQSISLRTEFKLKIANFGIFIFFILLSLSISFIQIMPTYTLTKEANRTSLVTPQKILSEFPYKFSNILTVLNPYIQGNPKEGTYSVFQIGRWGIFWENTTYFGLVQLVLILALILYTVISRKKENRNLLFFLIFFAVLGLLLSLGSSAPLHPIFSFPPFSLFRVPSRFLMFTFISASVLSGISIDKIPLKKYPLRKHALIFIILMLSASDIFRVWFSYNLIQSVDTVLRPSIFTEKIKKDARIFSHGLEEEWTGEFSKVGWKGTNYQYYDFFKNALGENVNILSNIWQQKAYAGEMPKRIDILTSFLEESFTQKDGLLTISEIGEKILDANNIRYLVTVKPLKAQGWEQIDKAQYQDHALYLWKNSKTPSRAYLASNYKIATTTGEFGNIIGIEHTDITKTPVLEDSIDFPKSDQGAAGSLKISLENETKVEIDINLDKESLVILSDSYYPGWKAYVDEEQTKIYPANINSRAIIAPAGNHKVKFIYAPTNIKIGAIISALSIFMTFGIYKFLKLKNLY